jgi:hypothetical protein
LYVTLELIHRTTTTSHHPIDPEPTRADAVLDPFLAGSVAK